MKRKASKRKVTKRNVILTAVAALTIAALAGCGGGNGSGGSNGNGGGNGSNGSSNGSSGETGSSAETGKSPQAEGTAAQNGGSTEKVTLKMLQHANEGTNIAIEELNQAFMEKYPNIVIESTTVGTGEYQQALQTAMSAGEADIIEFSCYNIGTPEYTKGMERSDNAKYIDTGYLMDLTGEEFVKNFTKDAQDNAMTFEGKVYSLPTGAAAMNGVFYNKKLFEENGLAVPGTWDEFLGLCETLRGNGIEPLTIGAKDTWPLTMMLDGIISTFEEPNQLAEGLWTGERTYTDEGSMKIFEALADFCSYLEPGIAAVDYSAAVGRFLSGKAAMMPDGSWTSSSIEIADPEFDWGYFAFPAPDGTEMGYIGKYDYGYAGYGKTEHPEEVMKWLEFYSQKENYEKFITPTGFIPAMDGISPDTKFFKESADCQKVGFSSSINLIFRSPKGIGKYGTFSNSISKLKSLGGDVEDANDAAARAKADWDAAMAALK